MNSEEMNPTISFEDQVQDNIRRLGEIPGLSAMSMRWMLEVGLGVA
jgi:hypothetical protein